MFIIPKTWLFDGAAQAIVDAFAGIGVRPSKAPEELAAAEAVAEERERKYQDMLEMVKKAHESAIIGKVK